VQAVPSVPNLSLRQLGTAVRLRSVHEPANVFAQLIEFALQPTTSKSWRTFPPYCSVGVGSAGRHSRLRQPRLKTPNLWVSHNSTRIATPFDQ
jgi:hypothetical protein